MNTKNLVVGAIIAAVLSLAAVQAFALPQHHGWGFANLNPTGTMSGMNGHMSGNMMNHQGIMGNMMNRQSMSYEQCQQHMGPDTAQIMNVQFHQQCQNYMSSNHDMPLEQCQAMHEDGDT